MDPARTRPVDGGIVLRRTGIAVIALLLAVPGWSWADEAAPPAIDTAGSAMMPVGACDGFAPIQTECSFRGAMPAVSTVHLEAQAEFAGRIGVRIVTVSGEYRASCDFIGIEEPVCRSSTSGILKIGEPFNAYGTASFAPPSGGEIRGLALGRWRVYLTSP